MIDTHCHLSEFTETRLPEIIDNAQKKGIYHLISVSACYEDWAKNQHIAYQYPMVYPAFGIHPLFRQNLPPQWQETLSGCLKILPHALVGEIGLDFYHTPDEIEKQEQINLFNTQIALAQQYQRPLSIHCRKAHNECITLIKKQKFQYGGLIHNFSGSLNLAKQWIDLGFILGIGTILLKENSRLRKILAQLPHTAWALGSDAPFMQSENTPTTICHIALVAAQLLHKTPNEIAQQTNNNALVLLKKTAINGFH